jgi:hypothetical protein
MTYVFEERDSQDPKVKAQVSLASLVSMNLLEAYLCKSISDTVHIKDVAKSRYFANRWITQKISHLGLGFTQTLIGWYVFAASLPCIRKKRPNLTASELKAL